MPNTWFVRPWNNFSTYGSGDGSNYDNAWAGASAVVWASVEVGDTIHLCGNAGVYTGLQYAASGYMMSNYDRLNIAKNGIIVLGDPDNPYINYSSGAFVIGADFLTTGRNNVWKCTDYVTGAWGTGGYNSATQALVWQSSSTTSATVMNYPPVFLSNPVQDFELDGMVEGDFGISGDGKMYVKPFGSDGADHFNWPVSAWNGAHTGVVYFNGYSDTQINNLTVYGGTLGGRDCPRTTWDGNHIEWAGYPIAVESTTATNSAGSPTIKNNILRHCGNGIYIISAGQWPGDEGHWRHTNNALIELNTIEQTADFPQSTDCHAIAIMSGSGHVVRKNKTSGHTIGVAWYTDSFEVYADATCEIYQNFCVNAVQIFQEAGWRFGHGIAAFGAKPTGYNMISQIYDNICADNIWSGIYGMGPNSTGCVLNIYNNTLRGNQSNLYLVNDSVTSGIKAVVKNNINVSPQDNGAIAVSVPWGHTSFAIKPLAGTVNITIDNNDYYPNVGSGTPFMWSVDTEVSWDTWKTNTSGEASSITGDPLFLNAGGSYAIDTDFKLQSGSPCINAGVDVGLTTDYGGFTIIGNPDIGAWEYGGVIYSREASSSLPTDAASLTTFYTPDEVADVATVDGIRVAQIAPSQYAIHEFKNDASGKSSCTVTWWGQTTLGNTTDFPTILEIYNTITHAWVELDRNTDADPDTNFELTFPITSGLDNYKDTNGFITCRVYQSSISR